MKKSNQKRIDQIAQEKLSDINKKSPQFQVMWAINNFRNALLNEGITDEEIDENNITHSEKIHADSKHYSQFKYLARLSVNYFDAVDCFCINKISGDGFIFIGDEHSIYAAQILFKYLVAIAMDIHEECLNKLKRYKKQSTKENKVDECLDEWLDYLLEQNRYDLHYTISCGDVCIQYVKEHFNTLEDQRRIMRQAAEIIKPLGDKTIDKAMKWSDFMKEHHKKFPKKLIDQTVIDLKALQEEDVVVFFPYEEWVLEQRDDMNDD